MISREPQLRDERHAVYLAQSKVERQGDANLDAVGLGNNQVGTF